MPPAQHPLLKSFDTCPGPARKAHGMMSNNGHDRTKRPRLPFLSRRSSLIPEQTPFRSQMITATRAHTATISWPAGSPSSHVTRRRRLPGHGMRNARPGVEVGTAVRRTGRARVPAGTHVRRTQTKLCRAGCLAADRLVRSGL